MSPRWKEIIRAVLFSSPAVMMASGSGTIPPSYRNRLTWSLVPSSAHTLLLTTK